MEEGGESWGGEDTFEGVEGGGEGAGQFDAEAGSGYGGG